MKICFDTCVVIDLFVQSEFSRDSFTCYDVAQIRQDDALIPLHSAADIDYILHRRGMAKGQARAAVSDVMEMFDLLDLIPADAVAAAASSIPDYEDALVAFSAKRAGADLIITRDAGFENSPVPVMTPAQYVSQYCPAGYEYGFVRLDA